MYRLQAVIAAEHVLHDLAGAYEDARVVPLGQHLSLLPMTDELFDAVTVAGATHLDGFWKAPSGFGRALAACSANGRSPTSRPNTSAEQANRPPWFGTPGKSSWAISTWPRRPQFQPPAHPSPRHCGGSRSPRETTRTSLTRLVSADTATRKTGSQPRADQDAVVRFRSREADHRVSAYS